MKNTLKPFAGFFLCFLLFTASLSAQQTIVQKYGKLSVKGNYIMSEYGDTVQLRGVSLFWSQWMPQYYKSETIEWLAKDWKCTVVRAAMGVDMEGYATHPLEEQFKIQDVVDAAIYQGIYVIIDFHSHQAHKDPAVAKKFFSDMAKKYGKYPNVIYEIYNEPLQDAYWSKDIKPYADSVIKSIRAFDPDNLILVGTRQWSQMVNEAADNQIKDPNVAYVLHFYAVSHGQYLRDEAEKAMAKGIAIFVSEFGTTEYTGDGAVGYKQTQEWFDFMDKYKISWCCWSIADKNETSAILKPGTGPSDWDIEQVTPSGQFIRKEIILKNTPLLRKVKK